MHRYLGLAMLSLSGTFCLGQATSAPATNTKEPVPVLSPDDFPRTLKPIPLYHGEIPNSIPGPNEEQISSVGDWAGFTNVSVPAMTVYLPARNKSSHAAVIVFPGGGYQMLAWDYEGTSTAKALQDHGVTAIVVKYRLPSDKTMPDKSIGPLQDAQQAIRLTRQHAAEWQIDPNQIGIMGFSAGGHLASTAGTHFSKAYVPNPENTDLRPSFMILIYPVISMTDELAHKRSRDALLGPKPSEERIALFSNEKQVSDQTPPTFLVHAGDDAAVDVDNSVLFYEALHHHQVPAELVVLPKGDHGFFRISRDQWLQPLFGWMIRNGWMKP